MRMNFWSGLAEANSTAMSVSWKVVRTMMSGAASAASMLARLLEGSVVRGLGGAAQALGRGLGAGLAHLEELVLADGFGVM